MFLEERHRELGRQVRAFADEVLAPIEHREDGVDGSAGRSSGGSAKRASRATPSLQPMAE